jgi:hypothetical protein
MGGVFKAIGKAVKGIFKGIKKVFSAVGKAVSKIFGSKLGKILLIAAAIFTGGAALGLWATPFATAAGTAGAGVGMSTAAGMTAGTAGVSTAAAGAFEGLGMIGATGATGAAGAAGAGGFTAALGGGQLASAAAPGFLAETVGSAVGANTGLAAAGAAANAAGIAPVVTAGVNSGGTILAGAGSQAASGFMGTIGKVVSGVEGWMKAHPMLTQIGGNMLSSMFKEDPYDKYADAQIKLKEWERDNSTIAGVRYDGSGTPIDLNEMGLQDIAQRHAAQAPKPQQVAYQPTPYIPAPLPQDPSKTGLLAKYYGAA